MGHFFALRSVFGAFLCALTLAWAAASTGQSAGGEPDSESALLDDIRQLTFEGKRSGEGYFSRDGSKLVFQSEREPGNPFYQIYLMDLETGDVSRISPGIGKTTCSWIHPFENKVLFASTHGDPESRRLQEEELEFRASGKERRYAWDYDRHFDIYTADFEGNILNQLTDAEGYDAEGSYSPNGKLVAFASNRHAYTDPMSEEDQRTFESDKSYMMDIYIMNADGSDARRLTNVEGYDGGPFFSPDGNRITWRRFSPDGVTAEIFTMNVDGADQRQLTELGAMSWAPYYHPSGDYLIFATNKHGFGNFELYLVDVAGEREPVRVTATDGFDGLPVFSPDGSTLAWTSNRNGPSQLFMASWDDAEARRRLARSEPRQNPSDAPDLTTTTQAIDAGDLRAHVTYLASGDMAGRRTGTRGEQLATTYVAKVFEHLGLHPAGDNGTYFQEFEFTAGVSLGEGNELNRVPPHRATGIDDAAPRPKDWVPLAFSQTGETGHYEVVFAGYGIRAPATEEFDEYDSFVHLDVKDRWVMVLRYLPEDIPAEQKQHLGRPSILRFKAMTLRELGAAGMIVVSGPNSGVEDELVPLQADVASGSMSLFAISITDNLAEEWLLLENKSLKELQSTLDSGEIVMGFPLERLGTIGGRIDLVQEKRVGRNVLGRLNAGDGPSDSAIVVGAHIDHLGVGRSGESLARDDEKSAIHYGADDNASGVSGMLEIAQYLVDAKARGLEMNRDAVFAAWSGEELALLGSNHYVTEFEGKEEGESLQPEIAAYLNMDMIGRLDENLIVQGVASSTIWPSEIERRNVPVGLSIKAVDETYLPTDATSFYLHGVPFLNAFTGAHEDYHTPRDTADKINYDGAEDVARFVGLLARSLVTRGDIPDYQKVERPEGTGQRGGVMRVYLGTIPDYAQDVTGVKLSGVTAGAPADDAGLKQGDVIVELAGRTIENIYDYTYAMEALKIGEPVLVVVERGRERVELSITPGSRE